MIHLKDIKNGRITRTIIGKPSSTDVSILSEVEYVDCLTNEPLSVEDCDSGLIYFTDGDQYIKLSTLERISCIAIDVDSLHDHITVGDLIFPLSTNDAKMKYIKPTNDNKSYTYSIEKSKEDMAKTLRLPREYLE